MGQILVCKFDGFKVPEMVKTRPVIIIAPRLPRRSKLVSIVPISTTAPEPAVPYAVKLSKNYNPAAEDDLDCWAKCDLVLNLSTERLSGFKVDRRKWEYPQLTGENLRAVRQGVLYGLGMHDLLNQG